jgi:hypothetical protein
MNQFRLAIDPDMGLHAEVPLIPFLRLMHLRISLLRPILRRTGRTDDGRITNGPSAHLQPMLGQLLFDPGTELLAHLVVGFQQMPRLTDRRLIGHGLAA